jgi:predicted 2-oxoglutarate/Fe(II)-dependent dioxygenase YbiX
MDNSNVLLKDLIHVKKGAIPSEVCDSIVSQIKKQPWHKHVWYDYGKNAHDVREKNIELTSGKELDVQACTIESQEILTDFITTELTHYIKKYCEVNLKPVYKFSSLRFNRYSAKQTMIPHIDHIRSLFDGEEKGIPVLSVIINFNNDYKGGELFFWDEHIIPLSKGDIVVFPSLFLFKHGVKAPTEGTRYSAVCWAF